MTTNGITATLGVRVTAQDAITPPVGGANQQVNLTTSVLYAPGNGAAGLADKMVTLNINIAASGTHVTDLTTDLDAFGVALGFADVQAVYLQADAANVNNIVLGNSAAPWQGPFDAVTDTIAVKPGGVLLMADPLGWPVTATTHDEIMLANSGSGTAVTGKLVVIGRSA